jgi:nitrogen fixation-related uncharacterized protein
MLIYQMVSIEILLVYVYGFGFLWILHTTPLGAGLTEGGG